MEFRCRLGTAAGQVIEGIYIAPSEAHLRRELEDFVEAVRTGRPPQVTGEQGRAALALAAEIVERMAHVR